MRSTYYFAVMLLFAAAASAQSPGKTLKQAEKALGGSKALQAVHSVLKTGHVKRLSDGAEGKYTLQTMQPSFYNETIEVGGFETEYGYNGRSGGGRSSREGLETYTGESSRDFQAFASYRNWLWLNAKNDKSKLTVGPAATVDGKPANTVMLTTPKGAIVKVFFDAVSALPLRDEVRVGDRSRTCDYSDHRDVSGVKLPFQSRCEIAGERYEITLDEIRVNPQIARSEFDFPNIAGEPLPDIRKLLADVQANEDRVDDMLDSYSFTQKEITREMGKDGMLREKESETHQLSFYKGYRITRLIEKNGKPLSPGDQEKEDKEAAKQAAEIEKKIAKQQQSGAKQDDSDRDRRVSVAEVLKASNLVNPRRERFRGRNCIVFDFEPNPSYDFKNAKSLVKVFGKTAGVMWIDETDKKVARLEAVLADSYKIAGGILAKLNKGAAFTVEKDRINDEIWLPTQAVINLSVRVFMVKGIDVNQLIKFSDYRKFATEVKSAEVTDVKKPDK